MMCGIIAILIIALLALGGWNKGAVLMIWSVVSIFVAFIGTKFVMDMVPSDVVEGVTFPVAFIAVTAAMMAIGRALKLVDRIPLVGTVDKVLGFLAGVVTGYAIVMVVVYCLENLSVIPQIGEFYSKNIAGDQILNYIRGIDVAGLFGQAKELVESQLAK